MTKRITALILALIITAACLAGCHDRKIDGENVKGAEIAISLGGTVYELDPALCLNNDSALQICGLLYDTLFVLDSDGKVKEGIVSDYTIVKNEKNNEYSMELQLRDKNFWSDGIYVCAEDVIFAWKRILDPSFNSDAACLLFDIKNASEAKQGDCSIDDVGLFAVDELLLRVTFTGDIDYDRFIRNLTSVALAPLREDIVTRNADWSKKPATTVCSGPFMLRRINYGFDGSNLVDASYASLVLERNPFYRRSNDAKYIDTSVTPYRLIIDLSATGEEQLERFARGECFFINDIALSARANYKDTAVVSDLLSTNSVFLNEDADIAKKDGTTEKLFADKNVRLALSKAIDRQAVADALVFARPATALVPYGVFETDSAKSLFRSVGGDIIATGADLSAAKSLLSGIDPSAYTFSLMVKGTDETHVKIGELIVAAWTGLGFNVTLNAVMPYINDEKLSGEDVKDIYDDTFDERYYANRYEAALADLQAYSPDAFTVLATFAARFSGQGQDMTSSEYIDVPHKTGFADEAYDAVIEQAYAEKDPAARATLLHSAETSLLESMPVIPVVFNQDAYLISSDLSKVGISYYGFKIFTKAVQKNWIDYIETLPPKEEDSEPA
jgi:oligopeptide transport system substrate-binding protein